MVGLKNNKLKIFIVEDDPLLVKMYEKALNLFGYETEIAFDGEEGFKKIVEAEKKPALILSDIMMPKMNGLDMLRKIKESSDLKKIPLVLLSNLSEEDDAVAGLSLGAVAYIVKSQYSPKEIVEKLREIISAYNRDISVPEVKTEIKKMNP